MPTTNLCGESIVTLVYTKFNMAEGKVGIASGDIKLIVQLIKDKGGKTKVLDVAKQVIEATPKDTKVIPPKKK